MSRCRRCSTGCYQPSDNISFSFFLYIPSLHETGQRLKVLVNKNDQQIENLCTNLSPVTVLKATRREAASSQRQCVPVPASPPGGPVTGSQSSLKEAGTAGRRTRADWRISSQCSDGFSQLFSARRRAPSFLVSV